MILRPRSPPCVLWVSKLVPDGDPGHGSGSSTLCGTAPLPAEVGHERGGYVVWYVWVGGRGTWRIIPVDVSGY